MGHRTHGMLLVFGAFSSAAGGRCQPGFSRRSLAQQHGSLSSSCPKWEEQLSCHFEVLPVIATVFGFWPGPHDALLGSSMWNLQSSLCPCYIFPCCCSTHLAPQRRTDAQQQYNEIIMQFHLHPFHTAQQTRVRGATEAEWAGRVNEDGDYGWGCLPVPVMPFKPLNGPYGFLFSYFRILHCVSGVIVAPCPFLETVTTALSCLSLHTIL